MTSIAPPASPVWFVTGCSTGFVGCPGSGYAAATTAEIDAWIDARRETSLATDCPAA